MEEYALAAEEALEAPDGWSGFRAYIERICATQSADRGLIDVLTRSLHDAKGLEAQRRRGYEAAVRSVERAQAEGTLRDDLVPEDLVLVLMANAGVVQGTGKAARTASRRFVGLLLDGLRSDRATDLPPPPKPRQIMRGMRESSRPSRARG